MRGRNRWKIVSLAATNGFALGNLLRHGRLSKDDPLWERAHAFDREAGFEAVAALADFYAKLPEAPSPEAFVTQVNTLATVMTRAASSYAPQRLILAQCCLEHFRGNIVAEDLEPAQIPPHILAADRQALK